MTATLSPVGTPIDMTVYEEHWNEELPCSKGDTPASVRAVLKCCGGPAGIFCVTHFISEHARLSALMENGSVVTCNHCGTKFASPQTASHVVRPVDL